MANGTEVMHPACVATYITVMCVESVLIVQQFAKFTDNRVVFDDTCLCTCIHFVMCAGNNVGCFEK